MAVFSDVTRQKRAERHNAFLQSFSKWLMFVQPPDDIVKGITEQVGKYLGVDRCILAEIDPQGEEYQILGSYQNNLPEFPLRMPAGILPEPMRASLQQGQPAVSENISEDVQLKEFGKSFIEQYQIRSFLSIPCPDTSGDWNTRLTVACKEAHTWDPETIELLTSVTKLAWIKIRNARLYEDLKTAQERFHFALENSPIFAGTTDNQLRFTWAYNTWFGFTPENVLGKRLDEILPVEKVEVAMTAMHTVLESGRGLRSEQTFSDDEGVTHTYDVILERLPLVMNEPAGISIVAIDISERKRLEKELIRRETQHRRMLNTTFDGVWIIDPDGKTSFINDQGAGILGYSPREIIGGDASEYTFPEDLPRETRNWKRRQQGINQYSEQRLRHKDGHEVWIRSSTSSMIGDDEDYQGTLMMFTDITSQKMADAALRESNERFRLALQAAPITVFNMDSQLRYTWIYNPKEIRNSGEIIGKRDDEILSSERAAEIIALKQSVIDSGKGARKELQVKQPGGRRVYDVILEPLRGTKGQVVGLVGAAIDVTALRRVEEESLKNQARLEVQRRLIQQREQERLQIARDLHDTVLQELIGVHFTFREALAIPDKDMRLQKMETLQYDIRAQIHTLRNYCNDLRPPSLAPFGLERAIRSHMSAFRERYPGYICSLNLYKDGQTLPEDLRMVLYRVYQEAISNVVKHAHAGRVWVRLSVRNNRVELEIKDNGNGFHLPERWPEHMTHSGHFGLLGMQERVEAVGGRLQIRTQVGRGTRVTSIIPIDHLSTQETE